MRLPSLLWRSPTDPRANGAALVVSWSDIADVPLELSEIVNVVGAYNLHSLLQTLVAVNAAVGSPFAPDEDMRSIQLGLARDFLSPDIFNRVLATPSGSNAENLVFNRHQILLLMQMCLSHCDTESGEPVNEKTASALGPVFLGTNDHLTHRLVNEAPQVSGHLQLAHMIAPLMDFASDLKINDVIGRAVTLWVELVEQMRPKHRRRAPDMLGLFAAKFGVELDKFIQVLYTVLAGTLQTPQPGQPHWHQYLIDRRTYFKHLTFPTDVIDRSLAIISATPEEFKHRFELSREPIAGANMTVLQRKPILQIPDGRNLVLDQGLLLKFFTHGIWACVEEAVGAEDRDRFREYFGHVFEQYGRNVLEHLFSGIPTTADNRLYSPVKFDSTSEVSDAAIQVGDSLVLLEFKGVLITPAAKYSIDHAPFKLEVDRKLVGSDESGKRKAVFQLAHSIARLAKGDSPTATTFDLSRCRNLYPVIVLYDSSAATKLLGSYLASILSSALEGVPLGRLTVRPLTVASIGDIEYFTGIGRRIQLNHLLASYRSSAPLQTLRNFMIDRYSLELRTEEAYTMVTHDRFSQIVGANFTDVTSTAHEALTDTFH